MNYTGVIIEESLTDTSVLKKVHIVSTEVEKVTKKHQSKVPQWTLHTVEILADKAKQIAEELSKALVGDASWYADFKNDTHHYIVFKNKVFFIDRRSKKEYDEAKSYGLSLGIPEHQVDFHPDVEEWKR